MGLTYCPTLSRPGGAQPGSTWPGATCDSHLPSLLGGESSGPSEDSGRGQSLAFWSNCAHLGSWGPRCVGGVTVVERYSVQCSLGT